MLGDLKRLASLCKGQQEKVLVTALLRERTTVGNPWIVDRLAMGHPGSVNSRVVTFGKSSALTKDLGNLKKLLKCDTSSIAGIRNPEWRRVSAT